MHPRTIALMATTSLLVSALFTPSSFASPTPAGPGWSPSVTERLVKLPQAHLKKSLDRDFARSPLADAIANAEQEIQLKTQTLDDLRSAADQALGSLQTELRHQLLAEKQGYLKLVKNHQDLRRQHLQKRQKVYGKILQRYLRARGNGSPEKVELIAAQEQAQSRFQKSAETVNMKVFASFDAPQSQYAAAYAKNLSAANALLVAINNHPAQKISGQNPKNKTQYLRQLVAETDSGLALIEQEGEIVGYMAKLVALDAAAFADQIASGGDEQDLTPDQPTTVTSALTHFIQ